MSVSDYVLDSGYECERLERQAALDGLDRHLHHLPALANARLLDAGCGSGALARLIASRNPSCDVVGVDLNPNYVAYAQEKCRAAALENLSFEQGDLRDLRFDAASFDVIWSRFVLYFVPEPAVAIAEFNRVMRPGGVLIVSLHNWSTLINYPEDASLRDRQAKVFPAIGDIWLAQKMPLLLTSGGFRDVSVTIELDPIYSAVGSIGKPARQNFEEVFRAAIDRVAAALGGRGEAEKFIADSLAFLDRPDTCTYSLLWTIRCRAYSP